MYARGANRISGLFVSITGNSGHEKTTSSQGSAERRGNAVANGTGRCTARCRDRKVMVRNITTLRAYLPS